MAPSAPSLRYPGRSAAGPDESCFVPRHVDLGTRCLGERREAADVILVVVGDEDLLDVGGLTPDLAQARQDLFGLAGNAGIDDRHVVSDDDEDPGPHVRVMYARSDLLQTQPLSSSSGDGLGYCERSMESNARSGSTRFAKK